MTDWFQNHKLFHEEYCKGFKWQQYVADYFKSCGLESIVPNNRLGDVDPLDYSSEEFKKYRDEHGYDKDAYLDEPDLIVEGEILEIKSRNLDFSCPSDYPYDTIMVESVSGWEGKIRKPSFYICVSQKTGRMIFTEGHDSLRWDRASFFDRVRRIKVYNYVSPLDMWGNIEDLVEYFNRSRE